jgi:hypothetical protein
LLPHQPIDLSHDPAAGIVLASIPRFYGRLKASGRIGLADGLFVTGR